jgi:hypothetical protein
MFTIYEIRTNNPENPIESTTHPYDAIIRCAELRFAGYKATAYEVYVDAINNICERTILY